MRKYYISKFFALSVILMMNLNLINAQSRSIKGYVCNDSGDRLPGAIVMKFYSPVRINCS